MDDGSLNQNDDYKTREQAYIQINRLISDSPNPELMDELRENLPHYLCDSNQTCQRAALTLCESFFKQSDDINYAEFADILYRNCMNTNPDQTSSLLMTCLKADYASVSPLLYENLENHSKLEIQSVLGIMISYLATLGTKNTKDAEDIIKHISPLTEETSRTIDEDIKNQALSLVNSAKIICGMTLNSGRIDLTRKHSKSNFNNPNANNNSTISNNKSNAFEETWPQQLESENWKERKDGYTQLLTLINENYPLQSIDHSFLLIAQQEKHISCQNIVLEIIEKIAATYKEKIARKIREYSNIVVAMMSQKKNSRLTNLQSAFDSIALNVTPNPYEMPFSEILLKMMTNSNLRLREESLQFIIRVKDNPNCNFHLNKSSQVSEQLSKMSSDPSLQIREMATSILNPKTHKDKSNLAQNSEKNNTSNDNNNNNNSNSNSPSQQDSNNNGIQLPSNQGCNESIKKAYLRNKRNNLQNQWSHWIDNETLELLSSGQWLSVTKGLDMLQAKYNESDKSIRNALVVCFLAIFTGKTFTPKVMTNIYQNVLYYIRNDENNDSKLSDEAVTATVNFCIDKIIDKHNENTIFEILDECCSNSGDQFVFDMLYPHLSSTKSPAVLFKITSFFSHHLTKEKQADKSGKYQLHINPEGLFENIKPLLTHGDQQVRKMTNEICTEYLPSFLHSLNNENNKANQQGQSGNAGIQSQASSLESHKASQIPKQPSVSNMSPPSGGGTNSTSNDQNQGCLISPKLILMVGKMLSILDCRRGLEEIENILNNTLNKNGKNSVENKEFTELFAKLRTWFKDSNTNIVFSVSKVILLGLKLVKDVNLVSPEFLNDLALLLNFVQKGIRQTTLQIFNELFDMMGESFITNVFLPSFVKLNAGGRKTAVLFIRDLLPRIEITVEEFTPFVLSILADKNEEFRNAALPIIQKYMMINGGIGALKKEADQFPPAKKNMVLEIINSIESDLDIPENNNDSKETENNNSSDEHQRPQTANSSCSPNEKLGGNEMNNNNRPQTGRKEEEKQQNSNQINETKIPTKRSSSSTAKSKIPSSNNNNNNNNENLQENNGNQVKSSIQFIKDKNRTESDSKIAIFKPKGNSRLRQQKQQQQQQQQPQQLQVLEPLKKDEEQKDENENITDLPYSTQDEQTVDPSSVAEMNDINDDFSLPKKQSKSKNTNKEGNPLSTPFVCTLNDILSQKIRDPSIYVYQWISDLNSIDVQTVSKAAKMILRNLKSNISIFTVHFDPLTVSMICKLHSSLIANPIQDSLIRIFIPCIEIIVENYNPFPKEYTQQIIYECLGNSDRCEDLNELIDSMIELQTMAVFVSLLSAISDFNDKSEFALKLFEKCSAKVFQKGNQADVCTTLFLLDKFYDLRSRKSLQDDIFGSSILQVFDSYVNSVVEKYGEVVNSIENIKKFQPNSTILPMITPFSKNGNPQNNQQHQTYLQSHHRAASPPKPNSPLQKIRITKPSSQNF